MSALPVVASARASQPAATAVPARRRVPSIDLLRGLVMIVMALDHVRDYFHADAFVHSPTDLTHTTYVLFVTRWVTHFCAPVFVFLAGTSARLSGGRKTTAELSRFLWTRGLWLVFVEIVVLSFIKTFNPAFPYVNLQVIWAIGISMIALAGLVHLGDTAIVALGLILVLGHDLLDGVHVPGDGASAFLWALLHDPRYFAVGPFSIRVMYPLLPWIGVMALGYAAGRLYAPGQDPARRRARLVAAGVAAIVLFAALRSVNVYGDPSRWSVQPTPGFTVLSYFNVTKYPPSLLYLAITLGPALLVLATTERSRTSLVERLSVFGRVPMFYYLAHFLLIHLAATLGAAATGFGARAMVLANGVQDAPALRGYGFGLPVVYSVWAGLVLVLYPCCRWYDAYKRKHQATRWWLSYL